MSIQPNVKLNTVLACYGKFASESRHGNDVCAYALKNADGKPRVVNVSQLSQDLTQGSVSAMLSDSACQNDIARYHFFKSVADQFGGAKMIPAKVQEALRKNGFSDAEFGGEVKRSRFVTGTPLMARDIKAVVKAITSATREDVGLLADNFADGIQNCLSGGKIDAEEFRQSLERFFDAALPPKWNTSKNFDAQILKGVFKADSIGELGGKIHDEIMDVVNRANEGGFAPEVTVKCLAELKTKLTSMQALFADSKTGKGNHVAAFLNKFNAAIADFNPNQREDPAKGQDLGGKLEAEVESKRENPLRPPFSKEELVTLEQIAKCALGNSGNDEGGAGYMAFLGGSPIKFLTKFTQRIENAFVGLTAAQKSEISAATRQLRDLLVASANKISADMGEIVAGFLAPKGAGDPDLLLRTDVVKALSYMRPFLAAEGGQGKIEFAMGAGTRDVFPSYPGLKEVAAACSEFGKNTMASVRSNHEGGWTLADFAALTTKRVDDANEGSLVVVSKLEGEAEVDYLQLTHDRKTGKTQTVTREQAREVCELFKKAVKQALGDIVAKMYQEGVSESLLGKVTNTFRQLQHNANFWESAISVDTMGGGYKPLDCKFIGALVKRLEWLKQRTADELVAMSSERNEKEVREFLTESADADMSAFMSKFTIAQGENPQGSVAGQVKKQSEGQVEGQAESQAESQREGQHEGQVEEPIEDPELPESPYGWTAPQIQPSQPVKPANGALNIVEVNFEEVFHPRPAVIDEAAALDHLASLPEVDERIKGKFENVNRMLENGNGRYLQLVGDYFIRSVVDGLTPIVNKLSEYARENEVERTFAYHKDVDFSTLPLRKMLTDKYQREISDDEYDLMRQELYPQFLRGKIDGILNRLSQKIGVGTITFDPQTLKFRFGENEADVRKALTRLVAFYAKTGKESFREVFGRNLPPGEKDGELFRLDRMLPDVDESLKADFDEVIAKLENCEVRSLPGLGVEFLMQAVPGLRDCCAALTDFIGTSDAGKKLEMAKARCVKLGLDEDLLKLDPETMIQRYRDGLIFKVDELLTDVCSLLRGIGMSSGTIGFDVASYAIKFGRKLEDTPKILMRLVAAFTKKDGGFPQADANEKKAALVRLKEGIRLPNADTAPIMELSGISKTYEIPSDPGAFGIRADEDLPLSRYFGDSKNLFNDKSRTYERSFDAIWNEQDAGVWVGYMFNLFTAYSMELKNADDYTRKAYLELLGSVKGLIENQDNFKDWRIFERVADEITWIAGQATGDERPATVALFENLGHFVREAGIYYRFGGKAGNHEGRPNDWTKSDVDYVPDPRQTAKAAPFSPGAIRTDGVRTDLRLEEVGGTAPNHNAAAPWPVGLGKYEIRNEAVWAALTDNCKGEDCRQGFALAFNLISEYLPGLKNASGAFKADYLALLARVEGMIGRADPKDYVRLYAALSCEIQAEFEKYAIDKPGSKERSLLSGMHGVLTAVWHFYGMRAAAVPLRPRVEVGAFAPAELGAKATPLDNQAYTTTTDQNGELRVAEFELNRLMLTRELAVNCRGMDFLQTVAYALNLLSEKFLPLKDFDEQQRQDYLFLLDECRKSIASAYQKHGQNAERLSVESLSLDKADGRYEIGESKRKVSAEVYAPVNHLIDTVRKIRKAGLVASKSVGPRVADGRIAEYVKGRFLANVDGAEASVVESSAKNLNCLFYSIQKCLGGRENDAAAQDLRIELHNKARETIRSASNGNYDDAFRQAANGKDYPYFREDMNKIALMDYLVDVERQGLNIFADASLLSLVPDLIRRPVVLVNDLSRGKGESFQTNTYKSGNAEWDANEPIYIYYNGVNHYKSIIVKHANADAGQNDAQPQDVEVATETVVSQPVASEPVASETVAQPVGKVKGAEAPKGVEGGRQAMRFDRVDYAVGRLSEKLSDLNGRHEIMDVFGSEFNSFIGELERRLAGENACEALFQRLGLDRYFRLARDADGTRQIEFNDTCWQDRSWNSGVRFNGDAIVAVCKLFEFLADKDGSFAEVREAFKCDTTMEETVRLVENFRKALPATPAKAMSEAHRRIDDAEFQMHEALIRLDDPGSIDNFRSCFGSFLLAAGKMFGIEKPVETVFATLGIDRFFDFGDGRSYGRIRFNANCYGEDGVRFAPDFVEAIVKFLDVLENKGGKHTNLRAYLNFNATEDTVVDLIEEFAKGGSDGTWPRYFNFSKPIAVEAPSSVGDEKAMGSGPAEEPSRPTGIPEVKGEQPSGPDKAQESGPAASPVANEVSDRPSVGAGANAFTDEDREMIDEIAANAFGSGKDEGVTGGEGYMGIYKGEVSKFLTHGGERWGIGKGLTSEQVTAINNATAALKGRLTALANKLADGPEKDEIMRLLASNAAETAARNGLGLLSRKAVARIVTLLAGWAERTGSKLLDLQKVELADTDDDTSFKTMFRRERKREQSIAQAETKAVEYTENTGFGKIVGFLADRDKVNAAEEKIDQLIRDNKMEPIVDCRAIEISESEPVGNLAQQFAVEQGYTQAVANKLHTNGNATCALVFADGHYFGCGIPQRWGTQEETVLRDLLSPEMAAWMLKKGMIKKSVTDDGLFRYEYTDKLFTTGGGYLLTDPMTGRSFMFFSMPSLTRNPSSFDLRGNVSWLNDARRGRVGGSELTQAQRRNATRFLNEFYSLTKAGKDGLNDAEYAAAMKYLLFACDDLNFNMFAHRRDADVKREVQKFLSFVKRELRSERKAEFEKKANAGYDETVGQSIAKMIIAARKAGVRDFIGGPIGVGAFRNDLKQVAHLFADGFAKNAGGMRYVYPERLDNLKPKDEGKELREREKAKREKAAFEAAFREERPVGQVEGTR